MAQTKTSSSKKTEVLIDHNAIRQWAEARGGRPARVRDTGRNGDVGMIRIDFPGFSGEKTLEPIPWEDWFRKFDEKELALLVEKQPPEGDKSHFNKLVSRHNPKLEP